MLVFKAPLDWLVEVVQSILGKAVKLEVVDEVKALRILGLTQESDSLLHHLRNLNACRELQESLFSLSAWESLTKARIIEIEEDFMFILFSI